MNLVGSPSRGGDGGPIKPGFGCDPGGLLGVKEPVERFIRTIFRDLFNYLLCNLEQFRTWRSFGRIWNLQNKNKFILLSLH